MCVWLCTSACMDVGLCMCRYVHMYVWICLHACVSTCMYACVLVCVRMWYAVCMYELHLLTRRQIHWFGCVELIGSISQESCDPRIGGSCLACIHRPRCMSTSVSVRRAFAYRRSTCCVWERQKKKPTDLFTSLALLFQLKVINKRMNEWMNGERENCTSSFPACKNALCVYLCADVGAVFVVFLVYIHLAMKGFLGPRDIFRNPDSPFRWVSKSLCSQVPLQAPLHHPRSRSSLSSSFSLSQVCWCHTCIVALICIDIYMDIYVYTYTTHVYVAMRA